MLSFFLTLKIRLPYQRAGGTELSASDVRFHELLLFLKWLWESAEAEKKGRRRIHGPEHYAQQIESLLRRVK